MVVGLQRITVPSNPTDMAIGVPINHPEKEETGSGGEMTIVDGRSR